MPMTTRHPGFRSTCRYVPSVRNDWPGFRRCPRSTATDRLSPTATSWCEMSGVVEADEHRRAVGVPAHDGDRAVVLVEADPPPVRGVERVADEPADHEVVGDEQFVPVPVAGDAEVL